MNVGQSVGYASSTNIIAADKQQTDIQSLLSRSNLTNESLAAIKARLQRIRAQLYGESPENVNKVAQIGSAGLVSELQRLEDAKQANIGEISDLVSQLERLV